MGVAQLVNVRGAGLDAHVGQRERGEDDQRVHVGEVGHDLRRVEREGRHPAGCKVRDETAHEHQHRHHDAADEADLRYTRGQLRSTELRQRQKPYDNRHADEHHERVVVKRAPPDHIGQRRQHEKRHGDEPDRDLEPLVEQRRETPAPPEDVAHPRVDAARLPPVDGRHLRRAHGDGQKPQHPADHEEEHQVHPRRRERGVLVNRHDHRRRDGEKAEEAQRAQRTTGVFQTRRRSFTSRRARLRAASSFHTRLPSFQGAHSPSKQVTPHALPPALRHRFIMVGLAENRVRDMLQPGVAKAFPGRFRRRLR